MRVDDILIAEGISRKELKQGKNLFLLDGTRVHIKHEAAWWALKISIQINGHTLDQPASSSITQIFGFFF